MENDHAFFEQGFHSRGFYTPSRIWKFKNGVPAVRSGRINYLGSFDFEPPSATEEQYSEHEDDIEQLLPAGGRLGYVESVDSMSISDDASFSSSGFVYAPPFSPREDQDEIEEQTRATEAPTAADQAQDPTPDENPLEVSLGEALTVWSGYNPYANLSSNNPYAGTYNLRSNDVPAPNPYPQPINTLPAIPNTVNPIPIVTMPNTLPTVHNAHGSVPIITAPAPNTLPVFHNIGNNLPIIATPYDHVNGYYYNHNNSFQYYPVYNLYGPSPYGYEPQHIESQDGLGAYDEVPLSSDPKPQAAPQDEEKANLIHTPPQEEAKEGDLRGWLQVLAAFLLVLDGFGFITAFGVFQAYYVKLLPASSPSDISWIGSIQIFLLFLLGTLSGRAIDAGYFRVTVLAGFAFQLGGVFGASFSTASYWQLLLSQGVATGIGNGMHFTALVWLVSQYFTKRRGLALGFSSCGAPIGAVVFTVLARELIPRVGIQWTLRSMGFLIAGNSVVVYLIARPKKATRKSGPFLELSAFREAPYLLFTVGMFFALLGVYFAYYYVPLFGRNKLGLGDDGALLILIIMSAVGITGRLIPPFLADRFLKPLRTLVASLLLSSLNVYAWTAVSSTAGLTAWVVAYAFTANAVQTLFTASMGEVTSDMTKLGVRIGMVFSIVSFACLAGPPVGGALVQYGKGDFLYAQIFAATSMLVGGLLVAVAKGKQVGWKEFCKVT